MAQYTYAQLEGLWIQAGGDPSVAPLMAAIAEAESSGNSNAENKTDNGGRQTSWGLWQISDGTHNQPVPNILNPAVNAGQAVSKYKTQGLRAWGTYTSGAYKRYLSNSTTPDTNGIPSGGNVIPASNTTGATSASSILGIDTSPPAGCSVGFLGVCFIEASWLRAILGGALIAAGGVVGIFAISLLIKGAVSQVPGSVRESLKPSTLTSSTKDVISRVRG